ncbi:hypothetical protein HO133_000666 [Letharia lupina]|uniref:Uncharacterized protein n=1 Tax=Letharia lupina TaxID=560253 RepID=A0A8H6FCC4_9LECA|nr:uncharacterized protein HO133_000666 [Letharia lupina]KAF6222619.1 hypothetical protein HO133_000666 [Letharia lupina]
MATPRRRSSRIKGETPSHLNATPLASKLSSLLERDESPPSGAPRSLNTLVSSPLAPSNTAMAQGPFTGQSSPVKTPQTASRIQPPMVEMHPSKVHQSTVKPSASRQGFGSIFSRMIASPSKPTLTVLPQQTPSKSKGSLPGQMTSPTFDFTFERPESDLSVEAQKIMDSVREEAAKIKAQMVEERSKQENKDGEADQLYGVGGRKIAKPKGKSGRYSDVHKQEFKKMASIAGHGSVWKNKVEANASSLKRSPSKAGLNEPLGKLPRSKSFQTFGQQISSDRLENTSPGKRVKQNRYDDTSSARPVSRDTDSEVEHTQTTSANVRTQSGLPSAVTTPTKASLARSVSVKSMKTSMIPSLSRSASTKTLGSPVAPKTEGSNKYLSSLSRFGSMKSILHRSQPKFSNDPTKVAAGTHLPLPQGKMDLEKDLPDLPGTPSVGLHRSPTMKRVGFTPSTKSQHDLAANSPSPSKIPTPYPYHQSQPSDDTPKSSDPISYPDLGNSPNITTRTKIHKTSAPGDFTFRSEKTMDFDTGSPASITSPGSTIRHVRPSSISTPLSAFSNLPSIPHGMSNKKRRRAESDTEAGDEENADPMALDEDDNDQRKAKKQRMNGSQGKSAETSSPLKRRAAGSRIPKVGGAKEKGRMGISLGRLNMLARPKERR